MDVCGEGRNITRANLLELGKQGGLDAAWCMDVIDRFAGQASQFGQLASSWNIRRATVKHIEAIIEANRKRLV